MFAGFGWRTVGGLRAAVANSEPMSWYLKKDSGDIYGPVGLATLQLWATDGRVAPSDHVSEDQENWIAASDLADLGMDWVVELRDGSEYGPIHLLSLRDFLQDGSVSPKAKVLNRKTGEHASLCEALIPTLLAANAKADSVIEALTVRLRDSEKGAPAGEAELREKLSVAEQANQELEREVQKWRNLYEESQAAQGAAAGSSVELDTLKVQLEQARRDAERNHKELEELRQKDGQLRGQLNASKVSPDDKAALLQQVEKWKMMYEHERETAKAEKGRPRSAAPAAPVARGEGPVVPRSVLEDVERKLAQTERSYQQLLRTLNRARPKSVNQAPPPPDNLRRRDIS